MSTITIGVDLAKSVFSVCEVNSHGHVLRRLDLKRDAFAVWLAQVNEQGLRVRFIHRSESATPTQQDRLRKCSLTIVAARRALTRSTRHAGQHHDRQRPESPAQKHHASGVDGESLTIVRPRHSALEKSSAVTPACLSMPNSVPSLSSR